MLWTGVCDAKLKMKRVRIPDDQRVKIKYDKGRQGESRVYQRKGRS